ncbi:venom peptide SjAPI-like [Belonocnema kinseyi]|uniref:venom peptide SjAPI-like n=1 Tax=Belonocnema kinseyi TaxID=2817044 RepID=UPI00143D1E1A|nr:venom peptide SjAPI-like [Belonocnema kinseyi]
MSLIFIVLLIALAIARGQLPSCEPNAIWTGTLCTKDCQKTCDNYQIIPPPTCLRTCSKGCRCKNDEGFIRDTKTGDCVQPYKCSQ